MKILGFEFRSKTKEKEIRSPVVTDLDDSSVIKVDNTPGSSAYSLGVINLDTNVTNENALIEQYRSLVHIPEVKQCINEITSESIIYPDVGKAVKVVVDDVDGDDRLKESIQDSFEYIYELLLFDRRGHEIFKRWFVDGRLRYFVGVGDSPGIDYLQYIDPRKIKSVTELEREYDSESRSIKTKSQRKYFLYNESGVGQELCNNNGALQRSQDKILTEDSVIDIASGNFDPQTGLALGYLHGAVRAANNLRMIEDATLIYKLARAPERRVIYVDTGDLPKAKAEQYVQELANKQRTKVVYDANTGEIRNDRKFTALTEDFWLPRRGGSTGTTIDTLPGGSQLGQMEEVEYFRDKLYTAMGVPRSRFEDNNMFSSGVNVTRDELRFLRVISQYRASFATLFEELLKRQLILTNTIDIDDWDIIRGQIRFDFADDGHFAEAVRMERLQSLTQVVGMLDGFVGRYISKDYVWRHVFSMNDEEIKEQKNLIKAEESDGSEDNKEDREDSYYDALDKIDKISKIDQDDKEEEPEPEDLEEMTKIFNMVNESYF